MKTQFSYLTLLVVTVLASFVVYAMASLDGAEVVWILFVAGVGIATWLKLKWIGTPLTLIALAICIGHVNGVRVYGSPKVVPVVLSHPITIERLELPNTLVLSDGSRKTLDGVIFKQALSLRTTPAIVLIWSNSTPYAPSKKIDELDADERAAFIWQMARPVSRRNLKVGEGFEAELTPLLDSTVRGKTLRQIHYWCGNSFFARSFPRNLPSANVVDLGEILVGAGVAEPRSSDAAYSERLEVAQILEFYAGTR